MVKLIYQIALLAAIAGLWYIYFNPSLYEREKTIALTRHAHDTDTLTDSMLELENWLPESKRENTVKLANMGSTVSFAGDWKIPEWVAVKLTALDSFSPEELAGISFKRDPRAEASAYPREFSDKKYLVVRAITDGIGTMYGPKALQQAKMTSAAFPLTPKAAKTYEQIITAIYNDLLPKYKTVYYFVGAVPRKNAKDAEILNGSVYVPAGIFVITAYNDENGKLKIHTFGIGQDGIKTNMRLSAMENLTGLVFFPKQKQEISDKKASDNE